MNRKTMLQLLKQGQDALEVSIKKWEDIVTGRGEDLENQNCALCETHHNSPTTSAENYAELACNGCPIFLKTGVKFCQVTPYERYSSDPTEENAEDELAFLISLRTLVPEESKKEI